MPILTGITLPFQFNEVGGVTISDPIDKIKNNVQTVIQTLVGSRFMETGYGSTIPSLLGDVADPATKAAIITEVVNKVGVLVPEIVILSVNILDTEVPTTFQLVVVYQVIAFEVTDTMLMTL